MILLLRQLQRRQRNLGGDEQECVRLEVQGEELEQEQEQVQELVLELAERWRAE